MFVLHRLTHAMLRTYRWSDPLMYGDTLNQANDSVCLITRLHLTNLFIASPEILTTDVPTLKYSYSTNVNRNPLHFVLLLVDLVLN